LLLIDILSGSLFSGLIFYRWTETVVFLLCAVLSDERSCVSVVLYGSGHLIPTGDEEALVHDSVEAILEQCRSQNRQLISEMRELLFEFCYTARIVSKRLNLEKYLANFVFFADCCKLEPFDLLEMKHSVTVVKFLPAE